MHKRKAKNSQRIYLEIYLIYKVRTHRKESIMFAYVHLVSGLIENIAFFSIKMHF